MIRMRSRSSKTSLRTPVIIFSAHHSKPVSLLQLFSVCMSVIAFAILWRIIVFSSTSFFLCFFPFGTSGRLLRDCDFLRLFLSSLKKAKQKKNNNNNKKKTKKNKNRAFTVR